MNQYNPEFVEKYQILLKKDPKSKVFALLADAYRKMKLYKQALELCEKGIKYNPDFAAGYIALARTCYSTQKYLEAKQNLTKACQLSNDNLLAHQLMAECELKLKNPKKALKQYKLVLFLDPNHTRAQIAVKKLESITADEYEKDLFSMEKLSFTASKLAVKDQASDELELEPVAVEPQSTNELVDRYISLVDAFISRNDLQKAKKALLQAEVELGPP